MEMENHTCVEVGGLGMCLSMWESPYRTQGSTSSVFLKSSLLYLLSWLIPLNLEHTDLDTNNL